MDTNTPINLYLQSFMDEIGSLNDNATPQPPATKTRRRRAATTPRQVTVKPGWVPKPSADCPIVSWMENGNVYAVQNPNNSGHVLLKMELYDGVDMVYMCGLYLDKNGEMHENVKQLVNKVENMWIDKSTGVPKINGLTQTVMPQTNTSPPTNKRRRATSNKSQTRRNTNQI